MSYSRQPQATGSCLNSMGRAQGGGGGVRGVAESMGGRLMSPADWPFLAGRERCLRARLLCSMMLLLQADWRPDLTSCHRPLPDSILTSSAPSQLIPGHFTKVWYVHRACFPLGSIRVLNKGTSTSAALRAGVSHAGMHE